MTAATVTPPARIRLGTTLILLVSVLFVAAGWMAAKVVLGVLWVVAAVREGWAAAGGPERKRR